jgi:cell wall-associated NlpC family hydrolase
MTRTPRQNASVRRRLTVGLAAAAATLTVAVAAPLEASAETIATSSTELASDANRAAWLLAQWKATGSLPHHTMYLEARRQAAEATAAEFGISAGPLDEAWGAASVEKQQVLLSAMSQIGVPYRSRMSKANRGFDCSGLMFYAYAQAGIALPRSSGEQIRSAAEITEPELEPGDLVYYPGHVSMYVGDGLIVHSPQSGKDVEVRPMFDRSLRFGDALATYAGK